MDEVDRFLRPDDGPAIQTQRHQTDRESHISRDVHTVLRGCCWGIEFQLPVGDSLCALMHQMLCRSSSQAA